MTLNTEDLEALDNGKKAEKATPLAIVREKEIELRQYLIKTQAKADKIVEDSRKEAEKLKKDIVAKGQKKAQERYKEELSKTEKQAKEIRSQAPAKAKAVADNGKKNLDKAIAQLKSILAPKFS